MFACVIIKYYMKIEGQMHEKAITVLYRHTIFKNLQKTRCQFTIILKGYIAVHLDRKKSGDRKICDSSISATYFCLFVGSDFRIFEVVGTYRFGPGSMFWFISLEGFKFSIFVDKSEPF